MKDDNFQITKNLQSRKLKEICKFFHQKRLEELHINEQGLKIILKKEVAPAISVTTPTTVIANPSKQEVAPNPNIKEANQTTVEPQTDLRDMITAPLAGTFYRSPNPESPPFIAVGDTVSKGQTVGIVEAMKVMNEVKAPTAGKVAEILVESGKSVSKDMNLIAIQ